MLGKPTSDVNKRVKEFKILVRFSALEWWTNKINILRHVQSHIIILQHSV